VVERLGSSGVSELRSALEAYRTEELSELPDARVEEDFTELWRARELLETECLRRLPDLEGRGIFERDGHLSAGIVAGVEVQAGLGRRQGVRADGPGASGDGDHAGGDGVR
jgi:hypothetical protein